MKVVTYATHSDGAFEYLKRSFEHFSTFEEDEFVVLGWNEKWQGFGHRILAYKEYASRCDPNEVILCVDAHDIVLTNNIRLLENSFHRLSEQHPSSIFMSTEKQALLHSIYTSYCSFGLVGNMAVCAGVFIGTAKDISEVIQDVCSDGSCTMRHFDDQKAFVQYANQKQTRIFLDTEWDMFATIGGYNNFDVKKVFQFCHDGTLQAFNKPVFVLHHPGNTDMKDSLTKLGYNTDDLQSRDSYIWDGIIHCFQVFPMLSVILIILLVIIVFFICWIFMWSTGKKLPRNNPMYT